MLILTATLINSLLGRGRKREIRKFTEKESQEIEKINQMEFFDAIEYLSKLKK
jgi:hypothetical protein